MAYTNPKSGQYYSDDQIASILADNPKWSTMSADERRATGTYGMMQPNSGSLITESSARTGNVPVPSDVLLGSHTQYGNSWSPQDSADAGYMTPEQLAQWREDRGSNLYGPSTPGKLYTGDFEPPEGVTGPGKTDPQPPPGFSITNPTGPIPPGPPPPSTGPYPSVPPGPPPTGPLPQGKGGGWNPQGTGSYDAFKNPFRPMGRMGINPGVYGQNGQQPPMPPGGGKGGQQPPPQMQPFGGGKGGQQQQQPQMNSQQMLMQALSGMMNQPPSGGTGQQ